VPPCCVVELPRGRARREPIWQAHRTHFYRRATELGRTVIGVVGRAFAVKVGLCALAVSTVIAPGWKSDSAAVAAGAALVAWLLVALAHGRK